MVENRPEWAGGVVVCTWCVVKKERRAVYRDALAIEVLSV